MMILRLLNRVSVSIFACLMVFSTVLASKPQPKDPFGKSNPYILGINASFKVVQTMHLDMNEDGQDETIISYREPASIQNPAGGILIFTSRFENPVVEWHVYFKNAYPVKTAFEHKQLVVDLVRTAEGNNETISKRFLLGKELVFRSHKNHPFSKTKIIASSTLTKSGIAPANVFDRRLDTSWAEDSEGTGTGERITIEFENPIDIGLIGVLHGKYPGGKSWRDNNRIHRAQVTMETTSDRYDVDSELDLKADLGLGLYGDQKELRFSNKRVIHYFKLNKKQVHSLEIEITSVLLGDETDDVHISEIDFAQLISI